MNSLPENPQILSLKQIKELKVDGNSMTGSHELADTFNSHFSIATDLASKIPINDSISHLDYLTTTSKTFELRTTNSSEVFTLLSRLSKSKATGLE